MAEPEPRESSDEELMSAYVAGDQRAFRALFDRHAPRLLRLVRSRVGREADARDVVQQTFLQLHRAREDFRAGMKLRPWLLTIAMNLSRDLFRRRKRWKESEVSEETLEDPAGGAVGDDDAARRVRAALRELPEDQREVIALHWLEELSFVEVGQILGATPGAVRVRAHRGYVKLREILGTLEEHTPVPAPPRLGS